MSVVMIPGIVQPLFNVDNNLVQVKNLHYQGMYSVHCSKPSEISKKLKRVVAIGLEIHATEPKHIKLH